MHTINVEGGIPIYSWIPPEEIESGARKQAESCARHPAAFHHIALMPDVHQGYGMPIGGVAALKAAISPAMVGVDIGCGMSALRTSLTRREDLEQKDLWHIANSIRQEIPCGEGKYNLVPEPWHGWKAHSDLYKGRPWATERTLERAKLSLGTLGGGNHFIELQADVDGSVWVMLHSGSRGFGYQIAKHYMEIAARLDPEGNKLGVPAIPAFSDEGIAYFLDMNLALRFAQRNRDVMMNKVKRILLAEYPDTRFDNEVNIHHNFAASEEHYGKIVFIHRKGATQAFEGQKGIIPGSMGTASYIVRGKGDSRSFRSCSHGAGRVLGRMAATRSLDVGAVEKSLGGLVFHGFNTIKKGKLKGHLDLGEAPAAYKNIDQVVHAQRDLIKVLTRLEPLVVVKG